MNGATRAEGPTTSTEERICAARKQAADARELLKRLAATCGRLDALCLASQEPTDRGALKDAQSELAGALSRVSAAQVALGRLKL
jgi:hypothetical protein